MEKKGYCYRWDHKYNQHDIYVGSTENDKVRELSHRNNCHNPNNDEYEKSFYKHVRKYGTIDHWKMTVIYKGPNFRLFEKNYIKSSWLYNLNDNIPLRTKQEKKDREKCTLKAYREANRDKISEKSRVYREANREKLLEQCKKWQKDNEVAYKKKQREIKAIHRAKNKDKLNEKAREKVTCNVCGDNVNRSALGRHKKSLKCRNFNS